MKGIEINQHIKWGNQTKRKNNIKSIEKNIKGSQKVNLSNIRYNTIIWYKYNIKELKYNINTWIY